MNDYVVSFRKLPYGQHRIEVNLNGNDFSGPAHDFQYGALLWSS